MTKKPDLYVCTLRMLPISGIRSTTNDKNAWLACVDAPHASNVREADGSGVSCMTDLLAAANVPALGQAGSCPVNFDQMDSVSNAPFSWSEEWTIEG